MYLKRQNEDVKIKKFVFSPLDAKAVATAPKIPGVSGPETIKLNMSLNVYAKNKFRLSLENLKEQYNKKHKSDL